MSNNKCVWKEDDDGTWNTACDEAHIFTEGDVWQNSHKWCPYCGKIIDPVKYVYEVED